MTEQTKKYGVRITEGHMDAFTCTGGQHGLTKREYFAAMAMSGLLANEENDQATWSNQELITGISVLIADELIKSLNELQ